MCSHLPDYLTRHLPVVKINCLILKYLIRLMTFAGNQYDIPRPGLGNSRCDGLRRSAITLYILLWPPVSRPSLIPASTSAKMCSGSSLRGLSDVAIIISPYKAANLPITGRFVRSRSPPQPNTMIILALANCFAVLSTFSSPSGVWAKSTMTVNGCPALTSSNRPGTLLKFSRACLMVAGATFSARAAPSAANTL